MRLIAGTDAGAYAAHPALQYLARHHIEHDRDLVTGLDVAEVVLGHVGADPEIVHGDQGHRRGARLHKIPDIGTQVGHRTAGGRDHLSALEIQLGLLDRRAGTRQLRVLVTACAGCLLGAAQIRLGLLLLTLGRGPAGLCALDAADRERAWIFRMDLFQSRGILLCVNASCLGRLQ